MRAIIPTGPIFLTLLWSISLLVLASCSKSPEKLAKALYQYDPIQALHPQFSGDKALEHVRAIVDFGPRPAGSPALEKTRGYLTQQLETYGWKIERQAFKEFTPRGEIEFVNLRARFPVPGSDTWQRTAAVLLASHYDTKFFGQIEFVGANDGGSSTGVLLELARLLATKPNLAQLLELVFFDGEEALVNYTMNSRTRMPEDGLFGSRHYVSKMREWPPAQRPLFMVLLDMVGDKNLLIDMPENCSPQLKALVLQSAQDLNFSGQFANRAGQILDDHVPFLLSGIETVDLIDMDYPAWHTAGDTLDKISPESLQIAGRTALLLVEKHILGSLR